MATLACAALIVISPAEIEKFITGEGIPQRTSFGERLEFFRIGVRMFLDNPVFGVGAGQYHMFLADYTEFPHLLLGTNMEDVRFIPNNVVIEIASEFGFMGLVGFFLTVLLLARCFKKLNNFSVVENLFVLLLLGVAQPTFFILSNFIIYGVAVGKIKND